MDSELKRAKRAIRIFLRTACTDALLAQFLASARTGSLFGETCRLLAARVIRERRTAVTQDDRSAVRTARYTVARVHLTTSEAEWAIYRLGFIGRPTSATSDQFRSLRFAPMIRAEIRRRLRPPSGPIRVQANSSLNDEHQTSLGH